MVEVVLTKRKSPVLTPSAIPCLQSLPTINLTRGCSFGCVYCYIQGYPNYPGPDRIVVYENTPELVKQELLRKRAKPARVYFSSSSDAFQNVPEVLQAGYETMRVLLEQGIGISFLTKGEVDDPFIQLFARYPRSIFAQVGITSLDAELARTIEPGAATPQQRLASMERMIRAGVSVSARLDPLIPNLTDTEDSLAPLLDALSNVGVRSAAASFLFLRPAFASKVAAALATDCRAYPSDSWPRQQFKGGFGGGSMIDLTARLDRFKLLEALGKGAGVAIRRCSCKNPELANHGCGIAGPPDSKRASQTQLQLPLA